MRDRLRLPLHFDPARLREDLRRFGEEDWIEHFVPSNYEGRWSALPLRAPADARHPVHMIHADPACAEWVDTPWLARAPYFSEVLSSFACPVTAARLMRLEPGSVIRPHEDSELDAEHTRVRIHIPIVTSERVEFRLAGSLVSMQAGECWYLRLSETHSVVNRGNTDRVHLVLDLTVNDWLRAQLEIAERESEDRARIRERMPAIEGLRSAVIESERLQRTLAGFSDREGFVDAVLAIAGNLGLELTRTEVQDAMRANVREAREGSL